MYSVSYDSVDVLHAFAVDRDITFPLLSDHDSELIDRLGLRNTRIRPQSEHYGVAYRDRYEGVGHPGTFVLDERGVVVERHFEQSYRLRPTGAVLVDELTGEGESGEGVRATAFAPGLAVTAVCPDAEYRPWMRSKMSVSVSFEEGLHAYAPPTPAGYTQLTVELSAPDLHVGRVEYPPGEAFSIVGLEESFFVYEDDVRLEIPFAFTQNRGATDLEVRVRFQLCSSDECFVPDEVTMRLRLEGADHDLPVPPLPD